MKKANKYIYLFVLQGLYTHGYEDLTQSESLREVRTDLKAYRENEKGSFRIIKRRELNQ